MPPELDKNDRLLLNRIQGDFPITSRPFLDVGRELGMTEDEVIARVRRLLETGAVNRLGPVLSPTAVGGERTLAAMPCRRSVWRRWRRWSTASRPSRTTTSASITTTSGSSSPSEEPGEVERALAAIERETGIAGDEPAGAGGVLPGSAASSSLRMKGRC